MPLRNHAAVAVPARLHHHVCSSYVNRTILAMLHDLVCIASILRDANHTGTQLLRPCSKRVLWG
eukprot:349244-Amphidinium_carterae.1